jgi:hypothetical protein
MGEEEEDDDTINFPELTNDAPLLDEQPPSTEQQLALNINDNQNTGCLSEEQVEKMLNSELRAELKKRGLSQNGNKSVLTNSLLGHLQTPIVQDDAPEKVPNGFATTAKWRQLKPNDVPIKEPI